MKDDKAGFPPEDKNKTWKSNPTQGAAQRKLTHPELSLDSRSDGHTPRPTNKGLKDRIIHPQAACMELTFNSRVSQEQQLHQDEDLITYL